MEKLKTLLAIDGGGLYAIGVADWLAKLGNWRFDYYAGTSVGAMLAACYAIGLEPQTVRQMFNSGLAKRIFTKPSLPARLNPLRPATYDNREAQNVLREIFGDTQVKDTKRPLVIVAWNYEKKREKVFTSDKYNNTYLLRNAVLASMSAPTFFPVARLKNENGKEERLGDGGLCGNDPSLAGISAMRGSKIQTRQMKCLSIGTTGVPKRKDGFKVRSKLGWLPVIIDSITLGNTSYASFGVKHILEDRYMRISPTTLPVGLMDDFKLVPQIKKAWEEWDHLETIRFLSDSGE